MQAGPSSSITLYTAKTGNGRRAAIMLEESGLPYNLVEVPIGKGAVKPEALLRVNPQGTIPTINDPHGPDGQPVNLRQSGAILLYLSEKTGKMLPGDPTLRPAMFEWLMFAMTDVVGANTAMYLTGSEFPDDPAKVSIFFKNQLVYFLRVCDRRLGESKFLAGPEITIADIALYPVLLSRRDLIDETSGLDHIKQWGEELAARPAVRRALAKL